MMTLSARLLGLRLLQPLLLQQHQQRRWLRTAVGGARVVSSGLSSNNLRPQRVFFSAIAAPKRDKGKTLSLTKNCVERLQEISARHGHQRMLRVAVDGGGCQGFSYKFSVVDGPEEDDDRVFEQDGACVVVDEASLEHLNGSTVDFPRTLECSHFKVIANPNAEQECSCGTSFQSKL
eukprot:m.267101 g.267101  ORF g.267101 m.267101 type:complete len:177 (+) comp22801_c0_seq2:110-640(+)